MSHEFKFLTDAQFSEDSGKADKIWFQVGEILDFRCGRNRRWRSRYRHGFSPRDGTGNQTSMPARPSPDCISPSVGTAPSTSTTNPSIHRSRPRHLHPHQPRWNTARVLGSVDVYRCGQLEEGCQATDRRSGGPGPLWGRYGIFHQS